MTHSKILIAGGGFAGLACAKALAERDVDVTLLERKNKPGVGMHTTGIIVKECADEFQIPEELTRKVSNVRLFAPNLKHTDLRSSDYFFLTTDTPNLMRFLANEADHAGAKLIFDTSYDTSIIKNGVVEINNGQFTCDLLIGADGPRSKVADDHKLGKNTEFLLGAEAEYTNLPLQDEAFYCFLDQNLAHGYLGWVIPGVGVAQVGLAQRMPRKPDIDAFVTRMKGIFDLSNSEVVARRGGLIPCGGLVKPFANEQVILLGDAAGIVSPLTAGGIHTALRYGRILGVTLANYLKHGGVHPSQMLNKIYPRFYTKLALRKIYEHVPDNMLNLAINNPLFKIFAAEMFYRKKKLK